MPFHCVFQNHQLMRHRSLVSSRGEASFAEIAAAAGLDSVIVHQFSHVASTKYTFSEHRPRVNAHNAVPWLLG